MKKGIIVILVTKFTVCIDSEEAKEAKKTVTDLLCSNSNGVFIPIVLP